MVKFVWIRMLLNIYQLYKVYIWPDNNKYHAQSHCVAHSHCLLTLHRGISSMFNLSCSEATIFSSLAFLSSSISMANLSSLVAVSSLSFLSNSLSSPRFNLLRVARHYFLWSSVSFSLYTFHSAFLSSVLQSLKLCLLEVSHF